MCVFVCVMHIDIFTGKNMVVIEKQRDPNQINLPFPSFCDVLCK